MKKNQYKVRASWVKLSTAQLLKDAGFYYKGKGNMKAEEIANRLVPVPDNPTFLDRINQSMNKGVKHGITYLSKDILSMFPEVEVHEMDVDDALSLLQKIKVKLLEYGV